MAEDKNSGKKGFAGLDSMVSDVKEPEPLPEPARPEEKAASPESMPQRPAPAYTGNTSSGSSSGKWWFIGIGLLVFFAWIGSSSDHKSTSASSNYEAPAPTAFDPSTAYPTSEPARAYVPEYVPNTIPAPTYSTSDEEMPPVGSGLVLNRSQIRYCVSEDIRISAWANEVDNYSETSVDAFNEAVVDFNSRCSNFRYRRGMLESVKSEVESNRLALKQEGRARAAANP